MASEVFFADIQSRSAGGSLANKLQTLFDRAGFADIIPEQGLTAVKLHVGERGNTAFVHPVYVRAVVEKIKRCGGRPFLTDTTTLYSGSRDNGVDHAITAIEHGFAYAVTGAPFIVADGLTGNHFGEVPIHKNHFRSVKIAGDILSAESMIVISHFKGHALSGFGGAIKNLAMGCAPPVGKMAQHAGLRPASDRGICAGCGLCVEACPQSAIRLEKERSCIDLEKCIGCGECVAVCQSSAMAFDWESDVPVFLEMMAEYAFGAIAHMEGRVGYLNILQNITPECDCLPWSSAPIVPDIGMLASTDPVAIDAASRDLVNAQAGIEGSLLTAHHAPGEDKFRGVWGYSRGEIQISYGEAIGLGSGQYSLIPI